MAVFSLQKEKENVFGEEGYIASFDRKTVFPEGSLLFAEECEGVGGIALISPLLCVSEGVEDTVSRLVWVW